MKSFSLKIVLCLLCLTTWTACEDFVDVEPKGQLIPKTVQDFRALLDRVQFMNFTGNLGDLAADALTLDNQTFEGLSPYERNTYVWNSTIYSGQDQAIDWNTPYERIYTANLVLEGLQETTTGNANMRSILRGEALFHRAIAHYEVVSLYAKAYDPVTAKENLGIPLRLKSDVFAISTRPTLQQTYDQILLDLTEALDLLPNTAEFATRASKPAAHGLLARVYLDMGRYADALQHAEAALAIHPDLLDYNNLPPVPFGVFEELNEETLFFQMLPFFGYGGWTRQPYISQELFDLYEDNDLRKSLYFSLFTDPVSGTTTISLAGTYGGTWNRFTGLANDEIYLIAAECAARENSPGAAVGYINDLLVNRYAIDTYTAFASTDKTEILEKVIEERRKELVLRNRRWPDLKRYNKEPQFAVTLTRMVGGETYTLTPGDNRWVLPIPQTVIDATGMQQNPR